MKTLSGVDGAFLHLETPETPMHVGSLSLFELPAGYKGNFFADVKREIRKRLSLVPVFTRKLAAMPLQFANPAWITQARVDLGYHLQHLKLPAPGTQAQLEDCVGALHSELLDRSQPLWRLYIIDGLQSGLVGYYVKVHHAVLDGQAGVMLAQALFDVTPQPRVIEKGAPLHAEHPGMGELAAAALRHDVGQYIKLVRHLPDVVKALTGMFGARAPAQAKGRLGQNFSFGPKTPLNGPITGERGFAAVSIPMATLKQLAAAHEAKLNDVVMALCSGARGAATLLKRQATIGRSRITLSFQGKGGAKITSTNATANALSFWPSNRWRANAIPGCSTDAPSWIVLWFCATWWTSFLSLIHI